jgi:hypothetical protein
MQAQLHLILAQKCAECRPDAIQTQVLTGTGGVMVNQVLETMKGINDASRKIADMLPAIVGRDKMGLLGAYLATGNFVV